jgi:hypothetical protein
MPELSAVFIHEFIVFVSCFCPSIPRAVDLREFGLGIPHPLFTPLPSLLFFLPLIPSASDDSENATDEFYSLGNPFLDSTA